MEKQMELLNQFQMKIDQLANTNYSRAELIQVLYQQIDIMKGDLVIEEIKQQMAQQEQATL
jgi:ribosomal protein S24E